MNHLPSGEWIVFERRAHRRGRQTLSVVNEASVEPPLHLRAVRSPARWLETHERAKELLPRSPSGFILIGGRSLVWVHSVRLVVLAFLFNGENVRPRLVPPIHQHPCASSSSPTCVSTVMV